MAKNNNLTDFLKDVADAIRSKKGTTAKINPQDFSSEIASIETGGGNTTGGAVSKSGVNFYDYDGTLLHSYTKDAFLALSALPDLPTRQGLTCQGWNYTIAKAKEYVTTYGVLDIGATYITDDGKTRLYIKIADKGRMKVRLNFSQSFTGGVAINWGDGSQIITATGSGNKTVYHTFSDIGNYVISLSSANGNTLGLGHNSSSNAVVIGSTANVDRVYCNMLQAVEIGEGVTSIGNNAFYYCQSLKSIVIPSSVTSIGTRAFSSCYSLASIVIPSSVTSIGDYAVSNCNSLASIVIPSSVTSIGNNAFSYCNSLASIVIPSSVTSIGNNAFHSCYSLASIVIPSSVTSIGNHVFSSCNSLASIVIPSSVTSIGNNAFSSCYSLASIVIPSSVTSIGTYAFSSCYSLASIVIPSSVTSIGTYAFQYCYSLASIVIPSVTSIRDYAFSSCYSLASIVIPSRVTSIGNNAFASCYGMAYYDFRASKLVPTLSSSSAFTSITSDCKIVVPDSLYSSWTTATNWSSYASKIVKASKFNG